jgi:hypothetical protein
MTERFKVDECALDEIDVAVLLQIFNLGKVHALLKLFN